ncbi:hypothetical protein [Streptomyces sp. ME19-01-6]|uniref:hypothetical protein n=1 Tax=Streptomyces sp. ME19-01-6 TaxID=3028686 RepID=UPI0029AC7820|nr:hypothetical protein [Streptomyces sp. ME19-01-6]MDX3233374.1 hypothetical protein [Streptomyces sp. ME19-01-6]
MENTTLGMEAELVATWPGFAAVGGRGDLRSHCSFLHSLYGIHLGHRPDEHTMHATLAVPSHVTHPASPPQSGQLTSPQPAQ